MDWTTPGLGLRIGGHRGAAGEAPENTFAGFGLAAAAGVDYLLVAGGTVDDAAGIRACLELGIDLVDTNLPSVVVAVRDVRPGRGSRGR